MTDQRVLDREWLSERITDVYHHHLENVPETEWFHTFRTHLEGPILERLRCRYMPALQTWWSSYVLPAEADRTIFLYETRQHEHLAFTIYNACFYAPGWGLTVFCTPNNRQLVRDILGHNAVNARIEMIDDSGGYDNNRTSYNEFMKSAKLWSYLFNCGFQYSLMIELDAYLRDRIPDGIEEFDYVCSRWLWRPQVPGGGGLTIRKIKKMLEICEVCAELSNTIPHQDCWMSEAIIETAGCVNNTLFVEASLCNDPVGVHQWWSFIPSHPAEAINYYVEYFILKDLEPL